MTTFRIITGRAGTGKSSYCIDKMAEYIKNRSGDIGAAPAFLIVPEQFTVNSEKRLMSEAELPGLLIDEVLSFKRAACRVLGRCGGLKYELLSPSGKVMLLTQALRNMSEELEFYKEYASKPRGMEMILTLIEEFGRYGAAAEKLEEIAAKDDTEPLLRMKLSDLSKIYNEYRKLTAGKFYDSETLYKDFISELPRDGMFKNSHVWIDGFNGFTAQEFEIINSMLDICDEVNISICADVNDKILFDNPNGTYKSLVKLAENRGIKPELCVMCADGSVPPRFRNNKYIAHLEKNYGVYPYEKLSGSDTGIFVCECQNRYYEVEEIASKIKSLILEGYNYGDITVVSGSTEEYKNIISAVFSSHGIPFFIDEKRQISSHPLVRYIIGLLELISSNWSYVSVFSFLKTALYETDMRIVDTLENEILAKGIKGKSGPKGWSKYTEKCKADIAEASVSGTAYRTSNAARVLAVKLFNDVETFRENIKSCKSVSACCEEIINFLIKTEMYEKVSNTASALRKAGRLDGADEYSRIWNIVLEVISQADTFLGDKEIRGVNVKARYMEDVLANGFAQYKAGFIPHSSECVQIGSPERSKSLNPKVMILLGANEGVFPSTVKDNGLLTDGDRDVLLRNGIELSDDNKKRALYADFVMYTVFTAPSEKMFITYSLASSSGEAMRPSSAVRKILNLFPDISVETGSADFFAKMSERKDFSAKNYFEADTSLSLKTAVNLLGFEENRAVLSASRIEQYNGCPYSYLLNYCFRLKPRVEFGIELSDAGTLQHGLIENSFRRVAESGAAENGLSYEECSDAVDSVFEESLQSMGETSDVFSGSERNLYIASRLKTIAKKELKNLIGQLRHNHLKPVGFEVKYGSGEDCDLPAVEVACDDGFKVSLQGKIDRIDAGLLRTEDLRDDEETPAYFRVVDYKSSKKDVEIGDIVNGKKLQLIVYVAAVNGGLSSLKEFEGKTAVPAAAVYYGFENSNIKLAERCEGEVDSQEHENYMSGLYLAKENAMQALHGGVCKVTNKLMTNKSAIPEGGFEKLVETAKRNISESAANMRSGKFPAKPFSDLDACRFCDFKSVCRVNTSDPKNVREPQNISAKEFWEENNE